MKLSELETVFESKRVIMYNTRGDKAIYHNKNVCHIGASLYCGEIIKEEYNDHCNLFIFFDDISVGLWIGTARADYTVDELMEMLNRNQFDILENFKTNIQSRILNDQYFTLTEIEFSKYIDPNLESQMWESRKNYGINREKIERERREKREAEDQAYIQKQNDKAQQIVDKVISILKSGNGVVENCDVVIYKTRYHGRAYSILNYLARKYGVNIPIKTQGWINERLVNITLENGQCVNCQYYKKKGGKCSEKIFEYMTQLVKAIQEQEG